MDEIEVKLITEADRDEVTRLYMEADWWKPDYSKDLSFIDRIIADSFCFVGAFYRGRMIGMGRSISDGVSDAYIQDVTVLKEFRGQEIGKKILAEIIRCLRSYHIDWIGLIAEPGTRSLYEGLGFVELENYTPMLWRGNE